LRFQVAPPAQAVFVLAVRRWLLLLLVPSTLWAAATPPTSAAPDSDLVYVFILSRHGIRSPLLTNEKLALYSADPWPQWEVEPGILTPHGRRQMELMGAYYRTDYVAQRLLSGQSAPDSARIFFRSDNDERTIASAEALTEGLMPGAPAKIHFLPHGQKDPLLNPANAHVGHPDYALGTASILGQMAGKPELLVEENHFAFDLLERLLSGGGSLPAGKPTVLDLPPTMDWGKGPVAGGKELAEAVMLQYADGKPLNEVAWGRFSRADIIPLTALISLGFFQVRTYYIAQVVASNLAAHTLATLAQAAQGKPVEGALGHSGDHMAIVVGHDDNIAALGTLLHIRWQVPEAVSNLPLPGGALIFELRRKRSDGRFLVRTRYVSQTYDQMREGGVLTLEHPPAVATIFVPDCSSASPGYDAPLDRFTAHLRAAIDPEFTAPEPDGVR
jgi:4-phytase/acid phosphatase